VTARRRDVFVLVASRSSVGRRQRTRRREVHLSRAADAELSQIDVARLTLQHRLTQQPHTSPDNSQQV